MDSPDELYTLRAQFYLGHYAMSLDEARAISRRPLSNDLKIEREEFQLRALLGLKQYDKVLEADTDISPGTLLKARLLVSCRGMKNIVHVFPWSFL